MNSHPVSDEQALGDEIRALLAEIKDDLKGLVAFARQADYQADVLWNDPLFRTRVAALQAEHDVLEQTLAPAIPENGQPDRDLALLAGIAGSQLRQKVRELIAEAVGPFGLAQGPGHGDGLAADGSPGPIEAPGSAAVTAFRDSAAMGNGAGETMREVVARTHSLLTGAGSDPRLSEDDTKLRKRIDDFTAAAYALPERAALLAANRDNWDHFAAMGWLGLGIPAQAGGLGGSLATMMLVAERLGAGLAIEAFAGSVVYPALVLQTLLNAEAAAKLLAPAVAGKTRLAMACHEAPARGGLRWTNARATPDGDGYILNGCKVSSSGGGAATHYLVSARTAGDVYDPFGHSLFLVPRDTPGLKVHAWRMIDGGDMAAVELDGARVPAEALLGEPGAALGALSAGMDSAIVAGAFAVVGAMETALAATAELLRKGPQPGGVLCDTSLLRERCADMLVALEQARSAAELGLASLSQPDGRRRAYATSVTKAVIIRTSNFVCGEAIHLHGGMGNAEDGRIERVFHFATAANSQRGSLDLHLSRMAMFM